MRAERNDPGSETVSEESRAYRGWGVAWAGAIGVFFASIIVVTFPILLKTFVAEFGWTRQEISSAFAVAALVAATASVPLGALIDRVGPRPVVMASLLVAGLAFGSLAFLGPHLPRLYLTYGILGLAGVGASPLAYARGIAAWFDRRRGLALGIVIAGGALGGIVHPPLAEALFHAAGWRFACAGFGAVVILVGIPATLVLLPARRPPGAPPGNQGASMATGLRSRALWMLAGIQLCGTLIQNAVIVHLFALLTDRGIAPGRAAAAMSAMAVAAVAGRLLTGLLIDRVFAARVLVAMMALAALGAGLLSGAHALGIAVAAAVLVGFGTGGESDVVPFLVSRYFGLRSFSALFGIAWMANAVGGALGPILMGRAFDQTGSYDAVLQRFAVLAIAAGLLALFLPRYARSEPVPVQRRASVSP